MVADSLLDSGALSATGFIPLVRDSARARYERGHGFPIVARSGLGT